jgi:hypothetical protein
VAVQTLFAERRGLDDLLPIVEHWLTTQGYRVTVLANRVDAQREAEVQRLFFETYRSGCLIKVYADPAFFTGLQQYLADQQLLSYLMPCPYCQRKVEAGQATCPYCTAPLK